MDHVRRNDDEESERAADEKERELQGRALIEMRK